MSFYFDSFTYRYPSTRKVVYGTKGMVCTSQPLAAQAGLDILKKGGNAIDAAIATAICLTVVEPTSNGLGSDAFALVWRRDKLYGLNGSGTAPKGINREKIIEMGYEEMPSLGWVPVTVPGAPGTWAELSKRFGKLPFETLFEAAIEYAQKGYPVSPTVSDMWQKAYSIYEKEMGEKEIFQSWFQTFAKKGRAPKPGEIWQSEDHARTLQELAKTNCASFYQGAIAEKIHDFSVKTGGFLRKEDLIEYKPIWVEPIQISYKGYEVWEIPPNGHGIVALMALNILKDKSFSYREDSETLHWQIEALKLAFEDGKRYIADTRFMKATTKQLLSEAYAQQRKKEIQEKAIFPKCGNPYSGGTVYLCTADQEGNMVSYIQSNYEGFGSGIVIPETGIALQNRGANFSFNPEMENCIAPGKRPYHTIIPGFLTKEGKAIGPFGVMGGFMQPQGHLQVVTNLIDFHMNPQEALDAPRWQWVGGKKVLVEKTFSSEAIEKLLKKGHEICEEPQSIDFGRGQMILRDENGVLVGATEPRTDGMVAVW